MTHTFYEVDPNTVDVLALGTSHMYRSFQPNVLWKEYGITSYALGTPQQSLATSYFLLKEALNYQKPKVVLLESYYFYIEQLYISETRVRNAFDGMRNGKVKKEMLEELMPGLSWQEKLSWYLPFLKYHARWNELKDYDFHPKPYLRGGKMTMDVYENVDMGLDIPARELPEAGVKYFEKIFDLCEENAIELVVYAVPFAMEQSSYENRQGVSLTLEKYLAEKGVPFLFFQKNNEPGIDFSTDFYDIAHLNFYGQKKVTSYLGNYLLEHYGLADHRSDPKYKGYEEDYVLYQKDVEAGIQEAESKKN